MIKVLFVCLGNICRSPLAEGIFKQHVENRGLSNQIQCDSCGTSNYHIGENPDPRTVSNAKQNGVALSHEARQFSQQDFDAFDYILTMDSSNMADVKGKMPPTYPSDGKIMMIRDFDTDQSTLDVPDPYYGGPQGFQNVFDILDRSCDNLVNWIEEKHVLQ